MNSFYIFCFVLTCHTLNVIAVFDPCIGKAAYGAVCDRDSDCDGFGVTCNGGKCLCQGNYQEKLDKDSNTKYCVKLPDVVGAPCDGSCQFPMFCVSNKCSCVRLKTEGNRCIPDQAIGSTCTSNNECIGPFSACVSGKCSCITGATQSGTSCTATANCPMGGTPKGSCVRTSDNTHFIQNFPNSGGKVDNCPKDSFCYTTDVSNYGSCCPLTCPLGSTPDTTLSCEPTATTKRCNETSHYCHRLAGQMYSTTVCCRKPCREPNPVYINGKCYPRAYLGAPCTINEQCDGGYGMICSNGNCNCASGFKPYSDTYTTGDNPAQTCVRNCGSDVTRGGECFKTSSLGSTCTVNDQCPSGAACFRGTCFCDCRKGKIKSGTGCIDQPKTDTKQSSGTGTGTSKTGGSTGTGTGTGTGASKGGGIQDIFKGLLGGGGGGLLGGG